MIRYGMHLLTYIRSDRIMLCCAETEMTEVQDLVDILAVHISRLYYKNPCLIEFLDKSLP